MKSPEWIDYDSCSESKLGFLNLWVLCQVVGNGLSLWGFSAMGYRSEIRYRSREAAKLSCLRFVKKFMVEAVSAIDKTEGYSDPTPGVPKDEKRQKIKNEAEEKWIATLFPAGMVKGSG